MPFSPNPRATVLDYDFQAIGTFKRLSGKQRLVRAAIGLALLAYFLWQLPKVGVLVGSEFPLNPGKWIGIAILFYFFSDVFNIGFNRRWGRWPQYGFLILLGAAIGFNLLRYGTFWGPAAGWPVYLMQEFTAGTIGLAHLLSAATAAPG